MLPMPLPTSVAISLTDFSCAKVLVPSTTIQSYVIEDRTFPQHVATVYALSDSPGSKIQFTLVGGDGFFLNSSSGQIFIDQFDGVPREATVLAYTAEPESNATVTVSVLKAFRSLNCSELSDVQEICFQNGDRELHLQGFEASEAKLASLKHPAVNCGASYEILSEGSAELSKYFHLDKDGGVYLGNSSIDEQKLSETVEISVRCTVSGASADRSIRVVIHNTNDERPEFFLHVRKEPLAMKVSSKRRIINKTGQLLRHEIAVTFVLDQDSIVRYMIDNDDLDMLFVEEVSRSRISAGFKHHYIISLRRGDMKYLYERGKNRTITVKFKDVGHISGDVPTLTYPIFFYFDKEPIRGSDTPLLLTVTKDSVFQYRKIFHMKLKGIEPRVSRQKTQSSCRGIKVSLGGLIHVTNMTALRDCSFPVVLDVTVTTGEDKPRSYVDQFVIDFTGDDWAGGSDDALSSCFESANERECSSREHVSGTPGGECQWTVDKKGLSYCQPLPYYTLVGSSSNQTYTCPSVHVQDSPTTWDTSDQCYLDCITTPSCSMSRDIRHRTERAGAVFTCHNCAESSPSCCSIYRPDPPTPKWQTDSVTMDTPSTSNTTDFEMVPDRMRLHSACDSTCLSLIAVMGSLLLSLLLLTPLIYCYFTRRQERQKKALAGNSGFSPGRAWRVSGSMSSLPTMVNSTEYGQERTSPPGTATTSFSSGGWSESFFDCTKMMQSVYDEKWEIPHTNLVLGSSLGEGEFGRVIMAEVKGKDGSDMTAAVKMLKDSADKSDFLDLVSEYKLLKGVNHINIIRLIGAATQNGPFYVVVEYCKYGSLKNYLISLRKGGPEYVNSSPAAVNHSNASELLSFCWQISRGMQYLSEIKLVHRDLAARNILIADGKRIKISDFGLTRDVYEEDAYYKKSQGRIPVKWMAPESLYRRAYTSKSDVWSFGVVLWEVATLGATPYPGVAAENMYNLLQEGYRMNRPESCSTTLYSTMMSCWSIDPATRPPFWDLTRTFEDMVVEKVDYLDLSAVTSFSFSSEEYADDDKHPFTGTGEEKELLIEGYLEPTP